MKDLISQIFSQKNFRIRDLANNQDSDLLIAISEESQKVNYYLVLFLDGLKNIVEDKIEVNKFYESIMELEEEYNHQMDKNLSMLICARMDSLEFNEEINQAIYQVEEDPYFFKKYVLTYTQKQIEMLHREAKGSEISLDLIYDILNDHDKFLSFKLKPRLESAYNLISKIFIKLPFLNLKNADERMHDLSGSIDGLLTTDQIALRNKALINEEMLNEKKDTIDIRDDIMKFLGVDRDGDI